ncbi:ABC transporter ATP-binding protein, partial [Streptococcus pyogenes]
QRVQLARVLVNNPELVLLDEPLGALDAITRRKMQNFLRQLWNQSSSTFFMITHDIDEALMLATKLIIMNKESDNGFIEVDVNYTQEILAGKTAEEYVDQ